MADQAASLELDAVYLVGSAFKKVRLAARMSCFDTTDSLKNWLKDHPLEEAHVLLKGSRGIALERLLTS